MGVQLWHAYFGHLNYDFLQKLSPYQMVHRTPLFNVLDISCVACIHGKHYRKPFLAQATHRATSILELVHMDLCGSM